MFFFQILYSSFTMRSSTSALPSKSSAMLECAVVLKCVLSYGILAINNMEVFGKQVPTRRFIIFDIYIYIYINNCFWV